MPRGAAVMARRWLGAGVAMTVGATAAAGLWGCGVAPETQPRTIGDDGIPFELTATSTSTTTTTTTTTVPEATTAPETTVPVPTATIYLVEGTSLVPVTREVPLEADLSRVVTELQAGPTSAERRAGLRTAVPFSEVRVLGIAVEGGTATIDLSTDFLELLPSPTEQQLAAAQLVMTLTDRGPGIGRVRFTVAGQAVPVPRGDRSAPQETDQSVSRDDYSSLITTPE